MANVDLAEVDPVCGMKVQPQDATPSVEHGGRTWYFCCAGCRTKFEAAPARYDGSQPAVLVSLRPEQESIGTWSIYLPHAS